MDNYLKVSIKRNYGNGNEVVIELSHGKAIPHDQGIVEFDIMVTKINELFDQFAIKHLPSMRFSAPSNEQIKMLPAIRLDVTMDKGKRYIKVSTPEYSEYGIQWWPEDMRAANINPKNIPDEGYQCKEGSMAEILFVDGKPKKVLRIIAATK
jgi:hypothetical protein